jgi:hypothetical protein
MSSIQKVQQIIDFIDLHPRPISVTCLLAHVFEGMIIRHFILPKLPKKLMTNQNAFKPTGSTSAPLISRHHHVASMSEINS